MGSDLVLVSLGGVQRFISESRTTADVAGGSLVIGEMARRAARYVRGELGDAVAPYGLIFPSNDVLDSTDPPGVTNKIVFLAPKGQGQPIAKGAVEEAGRAWRERLAAAFGASSTLPETPGMPDVSWVCVTGPADTDDTYRVLWTSAQQAMASRRRARVFAPFERAGIELCAQSPHLPASAIPREARRHERVGEERLSSSGWVKRVAARDRTRVDSRFSSTVAIASAAFRAALLPAAAHPQSPGGGLAAAVRRLDGAVKDLGAVDESPLAVTDVPDALAPLLGRLGAWVYPDQWDHPGLVRTGYPNCSPDLAKRGRRAARELLELAKRLGVTPASPYYAVVVQDLDHLGRELGRLGLAAQREVSGQLTALADAQRSQARDATSLGMPVYAGGDDFLAFCPTATALPLAAAARALVRDHLAGGPLDGAGPGGGVITASTAVVFAHMASPLQDALATARAALAEAKNATGPGGVSRDALAVVVRLRGGERARTVQPWNLGTATQATALLRAVRPASETGELSASLASRLERDRDSLAQLAAGSLRDPLRAELRRMVIAQGGAGDAGDALEAMGWSERAVHGRGRLSFEPVRAAVVARFLTRECR